MCKIQYLFKWVQFQMKQWSTEGASCFYILEGLLLAITKCTLRQLLFKCSCICCGMIFQAVVWPQERLFPFLILAVSYPQWQKTITVNTFYHKPCKVDTTEVLLTVYFTFLFSFSICFSFGEVHLTSWHWATGMTESYSYRF